MMTNLGTKLLVGAALLATSCATGTSYRVSNAAPAVARLQAGGGVRAEVDNLAQPLIDHEGIEGVAVGVLAPNGQTCVYGYGQIGQPGDTIFQLGSVSKVFIAALLAVLVEEGTVRYDDTVRSILPPEIPVSKQAGNVTLYELATHTGGFPREPLSVRQLQNYLAYELTGRDVYAHVTKRFLYDYLRTCHIKPKEQRPYEYSNIGYGLLAHLLEVKTGRPYGELLEEKICRPLGLRDTTFVLNADQQRRLAAGHVGEQPRFMRRGRVMKPWDPEHIMGPCSCLFSTVNDLMTFSKACLGMLHHPLEPALASTLRTQLRRPGTDVALGWQIDYIGTERVKVIFKYGMVAGYHGYIGVNPETRIGVAVLCNTFSREDEVGHNLMLRLSRGLPPRRDCD